MKAVLNTKYGAIGLIILLASLVFVPFIGNCHLFDWDEINFAECAREMVVTGNYSNVQLNYNPFWEKPPFFIWLQAISMNVFGVNEFAARFPNAVCGIISLCVIFLIGKKVYSPSFGLTWVLVYAGTLLPHFYFKSGIIDPWFNLFIFSAFYQIILHFNDPLGKNGYRTAALAGLFLGLAVLTKGPAAIVIVGAFIGAFWGLQKFKKVSGLKQISIFMLSLILTGFSWFLFELLRGNTEVIKAFIDYQIRLFKTEDSDHGGFLLYHFVVLLIGCFPTSLFMIMSLKKSGMDTPFQKHVKFGMVILFFVVLGIFTLVKTKIVHYSSLCYLPLTYLATYSIHKLFSGEYKIKAWFAALFIGLSLILGIAFSLLGAVDFLKPLLLSNNLIKDPFAIENLKAEANWQGWEWSLGLIFILVSHAGYRFISRGKTRLIYSLYSFYVVFIFVFIAVFIPKIEMYTQNSVITFYEVLAKKDYYVETSGFKSYAYLFYTNKQPQQNQNSDCIEYVKKNLLDIEAKGFNPLTSYSIAYANWMLYGKIDKPAIFVCKSNNTEVLMQTGVVKPIYSKNGYVFFVRMPEISKN